jgi:hypothetical protein
MAGDVVQVGCKMPAGVILDLNRYEVMNKEQGTVRLVKSPHAPVRLRGNAVGFGKPDLTVMGYRFTPVPKDFWDAWLAQNKDSSLIADGLIKPAATLDAARKIAAEHASERGQYPGLVEKDERLRGVNTEKYDAKDEAA